MVPMTDRDMALRDAILKALPIDWDDRTTVVEVVPPNDMHNYPIIVWGPPERVADTILAAVVAVLDHEPNDIEATGECCCNGCVGQGMCDLAEPEERAAAYQWEAVPDAET